MYFRRGRSSVSLGLLLRVIVLLFSLVNNLDCIGILSTGVRSLTLLVGDEWLYFIDIIEFTIRKPKMVSLIETSPDRRESIRRCQEEELGHVENVEELPAVADIEPHPISIRLQTH